MNFSNIIVYTFYNNLYKLDTCTINNINGLYQDMFRLPNVTIVYDSGSSITVIVGVNFPTKVVANTTISFIFPSALSLAGAILTVSRDGNVLDTVTPIYYSSNNTVKISPFTGLILKP